MHCQQQQNTNCNQNKVQINYKNNYNTKLITTNFTMHGQQRQNTNYSRSNAKINYNNNTNRNKMYNAWTTTTTYKSQHEQRQN